MLGCAWTPRNYRTKRIHSQLLVQTRPWPIYGTGVHCADVGPSLMRGGYISSRPNLTSTGMCLTQTNADIRLRYVVLTGGMLITFKIKKNQTFHQRKKRFSLFGSFVYSGMMAHDELHGQTDRDAMAGHHRVYQDGLQVRRVFFPRGRLGRSSR